MTRSCHNIVLHFKHQKNNLIAHKCAIRRTDAAEWKRALPAVARGLGGAAPI